VQKLEFFKHNIGDDEKKAVLEALDGKFLTTGDIVSTFEKEFSEFLELIFRIFNSRFHLHQSSKIIPYQKNYILDGFFFFLSK